MKERFGELLGNARRKKKITLRKLGQLVGLTPSFLSEIEMGRRLPPKEEERIRDLALILNEDEDNFLKAARSERVRKTSKLSEKLFNVDPELALGLYRVVDDVTDEELEQAFRKALTELEEKGRNDR